ncbi:YlbF family regulator [Bacillus sp. DTU_2020_1000418_1_SI_GHA_SEK_038]|uniref:YlbF family regulator n=1 Tax=Bacillus sp. DTU_2020_1000418_1_SI_GHA_SEK_038 TaxID=3077585 RepID=UPI0028E3398E|nr:YlbF family regulator [Bacillus sp. DTU_2020_1000418_1_SI_GHA_SEK_038]WNS77056.1 YlbF family regulator [Bacillus sp. DTU_2020_1000418_1_SI_GHA_SEK_038]
MLATIERVEIIESAEQIANMIIHSVEAENYRQCLYRLKTSKETQRKIKEFVNMKEHYEEVQRFGKYHPDYKKVMVSIRELKREMDLDENVAEFRKAENDLQSILDEVSVIIGHSVSEKIKVPTGNPFFDSLSSCGGGCGSGGSCGCS